MEARSASLDILAQALLIAIEASRGAYFYDEVTVKRWVLGDGGVSGNCELCNVFHAFEDVILIHPAGIGVIDIDEPPAHPNCDCTVEYKDTRRRVYV